LVGQDLPRRNGFHISQGKQDHLGFIIALVSFQKKLTKTNPPAGGQYAIRGTSSRLGLPS
jgi:hypothetical protein